MLNRCLVPALLVLALPTALPAQDDVADVPSKDLHVGKNEDQRYFLIGAPEKMDGKKRGLILVLPGGKGDAAFHAFVKRMWKHAFGKDYVVAQLVAKKWTDSQVIVWSTKKNPVKKAKFSTEQFADAVIKDVGKRCDVDPKRVFTLSWSSGGPAAYAISLTSKKVKGSLVTMSVFNPKFLPSLKKAKGHAYYILHSPDDQVCPYRMALDAQRKLRRAGAKTQMRTYNGGHGWRMAVYPELKKGLTWLENNSAAK